MAKVEDADQRWIVKERDDGKNCNNWHWTETNLTAWSEEQLSAKLKDLVVREDAHGCCKITKLDKIKGDVTVQSRKQKKFPLYELELVILWEGQLWGDDGKVQLEAKGKIKVPDLSEETFDDLEMTVVCDEETDAKRAIKEVIRVKGVAKVREACLAFVKELKATVNDGKETVVAGKPKASARANTQYVVGSADKKKTSQVKVSYSFNPPVPVVYDSLLDTNRLRGMTASDCTMSKEVGAKFSMFSGAVEGENVALTPFNGEEAKIVWKWRFATWQPGHFSTVTINLENKDGGTKLSLVQTSVPEEEQERTQKGWSNLLFDRLKAMLGGSVLG